MPETKPAMFLSYASQDADAARRVREALAAAFRPGQAEVRIIEDVGHNTLARSPRYLEAVREFVASE